ncbi:MAG: DUF5652 family protein [Candidatus Paceibacterota bacterium]|jgi:methionyl-tRNA synthetase
MDTQLNAALSAYFTAHPWIVLIIIWSIIWKLIALWKASKNDHLVIFIILAFLNTIGIAEIVYLAYLYIKEKKQTQNI